jgi:hypothetical protein
MTTGKKSTHEVEARGLTNEDMQYLVNLADREFSAFLQSIVVPQSLDNQKINNF